MSHGKKVCAFIEVYGTILKGAKFDWPIKLMKLQKQSILAVSTWFSG